MSTTITIATFNAENLFTRYKFRGKRIKKNGKMVYLPFTKAELAKAVKDGFILDKNFLSRYMEDNRKLTARAIKVLSADIVCLQEIENLDALKKFNSTYLRTRKYRYLYPLVVDGNDPRYIDVGVLSNYEIDFVRTHQFIKNTNGKGRLFSRDCLEVHFKINNEVLPVFINHFKSMMNGRPATKQRRLNQANGVIDILKERFGASYGRKKFVVVGDLNDYVETGKEDESGIKPLLTDSNLVNVVERLPEDERWTHYYKGDKSYHQLDYILLSKALADAVPRTKPYIERRGQPPRVNQRGKPKRVKSFFRGVTNKKKASDHCPVAMKIKL